jgi:hypothetical protein
MAEYTSSSTYTFTYPNSGTTVNVTVNFEATYTPYGPQGPAINRIGLAIVQCDVVGLPEFEAQFRDEITTWTANEIDNVRDAAGVTGSGGVIGNAFDSAEALYDLAKGCVVASGAIDWVRVSLFTIDHTFIPTLVSPLLKLLSDPLILDLDGDGVEVTALAGSTTYFDYDQDGFAERTGWVSPDGKGLATASF